MVTNQQVENYVKRITQLEALIAEKDTELAQLTLYKNLATEHGLVVFADMAQQAERIATLEAEQIELLNDLGKVTKTVKYLVGIAERGTGTDAPNDQTAESFVLAYVKRLEAENERLRKDMERYQWLTEDHADRAIRVRCREIIDRLPVLSYSAASREIDSAIQEGKK